MMMYFSSPSLVLLAADLVGVCVLVLGLPGLFDLAISIIW